MRKVDDGKRKEKRKEKKKEKKRMAFLVATTSLPAVYRPNGYARTTTAGTPHARANWYLTCQQATDSNLAEFLVQRAEKYTIPGGISAEDQRLKMVN